MKASQFHQVCLISKGYVLVKQLQSNQTLSLNDIKIIPKHQQNIIYYDNKFILKKSDPMSNDFDTLLQARRDIENVKIELEIISNLNKFNSNNDYSKDVEYLSIHISRLSFDKMKPIKSTIFYEIVNNEYLKISNEDHYIIYKLDIEM